MRPNLKLQLKFFKIIIIINAFENLLKILNHLGKSSNEM